MVGFSYFEEHVCFLDVSTLDHLVLGVKGLLQPFICFFFIQGFGGRLVGHAGPRYGKMGS